ncbi:MAG: threonine synthase [Ilumatobacteraceae bacterium]|nr:threonine synthase [Ilumatobacteraceae bacterium]
MQYVSTRGAAPVLGFADVVLEGLAEDGGLYVPQSWPTLNKDRPRAYAELAASVMQPFVEPDFSADTLLSLCQQAYSTFGQPQVVPLVEIEPNHYLLELFHGPTLAFKDVALQLLGLFFDNILSSRSERITIVAATSGDTGSAAIDGVSKCKNVDMVILYPNGRVSDVQRRQMTTVQSPNVHAIAIDGTFDDCQDLVKAMFNDTAFRNTHRLAAVNSINWSRVMAQIVYYVSASDHFTTPIDVTVPTGNFGNVLSGWIAKQMGTPLRHLVVASNSNDILTRFFENQTMTVSGVTPSLSPSMDIQVSSNFERLLFEMNDRDGSATAQQLQRFRESGTFAVEPNQYAQWIAPNFRAGRCDDAQTLDTIRDIYATSGTLIDPHTAVGVHVARQHMKPDIPMVTLATAHPAKFPDAVEQATGIRPGLPEHLVDLFERPEHTQLLPLDLGTVQKFVNSVAH